MDAIRENVHQAHHLSCITLLYILGEKLRSCVGDPYKIQTVEQLNSFYLDLTKYSPSSYSFRCLVGNKNSLTLGWAEEETLRNS